MPPRGHSSHHSSHHAAAHHTAHHTAAQRHHAAARRHTSSTTHHHSSAGGGIMLEEDTEPIFPVTKKWIKKHKGEPVPVLYGKVCLRLHLLCLHASVSSAIFLSS